jgi:hypothetical protein
MKFGHGAINCPIVFVVVKQLPNFGQVLAQSLLQTEGSHKKVVCSDRESSHFMCETTSVVSFGLVFISGVTIEQLSDSHAKLWILSRVRETCLTH